MKVRRILFFATLLVATRLSSATEIHSFYRGVRGLGMGGAALATVNDETALLINPAALAKLRDHYITIFDPEVEAGANTYHVAGKDVTKLDDPQKTLNDALTKPDQNMHERVQAFPSVVVPNFGIGVLGKYEVNARLNSSTNLYEYQYTNDYAAVMGGSLRFLGGIVKVGSNIRLVNRTEVNRADIDPTSTNLSMTNLETRGLGLATDFGVHATLPVAWLPSIAAVARDIGRTSYTREGGVFHRTETPPDPSFSTADVALSISPILDHGVRSTWSIEYDGVNTAGAEKDQLRRTHFGFEFNFSDALFLRAGVNQKYWTAGLELDIVNYQFQIASYGEDIGTSEQSLEDRRYAVKFSFRF